MNSMTNNELREMGAEQLDTRVIELRRELFELRLKAATTHVKSFASDKNKLKKEIARTLTHLRDKQLAQEK